jgi:hypothetical protein
MVPILACTPSVRDELRAAFNPSNGWDVAGIEPTAGLVTSRLVLLEADLEVDAVPARLAATKAKPGDPQPVREPHKRRGPLPGGSGLALGA